MKRGGPTLAAFETMDREERAGRVRRMVRSIDAEAGRIVVDTCYLRERPWMYARICLVVAWELVRLSLRAMRRMREEAPF